MKNRLIDILMSTDVPVKCGKDTIGVCHISQDVAEKFADELIKNNVVLPAFKVGDVVWVYDFMWGVIPCEVDRQYHCRCGKEGGCTFEMSFEEKDIGTDVFATEKECREYNGLVITDETKQHLEG